MAGRGSVRVYRSGETIYACLGGSRRSVALGAAPSVPCQRGTVGPVAVAGRMVAYGQVRCGVDTGSAGVVLLRLPGRRPLASADATAGSMPPESYARVDSIAVTSRGWVAWTASSVSIVRRGTAVQVLTLDPAGAVRLLDAGPAIAPGSLRLKNGRVSWRDGRHRRSASYCARCASASH